MPNVNLPIQLYTKQAEFFNHPAKRKIMQKGRRAGGTQGAINYLIATNLAAGNQYVLWMDTSYKSIKRYWRKYWEPILRLLPRTLWNYNKTDAVLRLNGNTIVFYSGEREDTIEGDGFTAIYVNECGFLLKDSQLWKETLEPMLFDSGGSATFIGTPKSNKNSYHYELINNIERGEKGYENWYLQKFSSYDNPYLVKSEIDNFVATADSLTVSTEVYANFRDNSIMNFFYEFQITKHVKVINKPERVWLSFDFNINPMTCIVFTVQPKGIYIYEEFYLENVDIFKMCQAIKSRWSVANIVAVTGDASGKNRHGSVMNLVTYYDAIRAELNLHTAQIRVPITNPSIVNNRVLCNSVLSRGDIRINPSCTHLIEDLGRMEMLPNETIDKTNPKLTHIGDCFRYAVNTFMPNFIQSKQFLTND